jgi:hypothetical protein
VLRDWETAEATILEIRAGPPDGSYGTVLRGRIHPLNGQPDFEITFPCPVATDEFAPPNEGDIVNVYYDTRDHTVRINTDHPRVRVSAAERRKRAREEEIARYRKSDEHLRSKPGWPHIAKADDPLDMIARLADLHSQGELTDEEFAAAKKKLLAQS